MKRKMLYILVTIFLFMPVFNFVSAENPYPGIFLIKSVKDWQIAGFDNDSSLPVYECQPGDNVYYLPLALKKEDVHNLAPKDIDHTFVNPSGEFYNKFKKLSFEIMESATYYVVVYKMIVEWGINWSVDIVPKIKGESEPYEFAAWWNSSYNSFRTLTIPHEFIDSTLSWFPVGVRIPDPLADRMDNNKSLRFIAGENCGATENVTRLAWEGDRWVNGESRIVWVAVPKVYSGKDTIFLMYYNNSASASNENASAVWDNNFLMVAHLNESYKDSTSNNNDLTNNGCTLVSARIGYGAEFVATGGDFLTIPITSGLGAFTVEINHNPDTIADWKYLWSHDSNADSSYDFWFERDANPNDGRITVYDGASQTLDNPEDININNWFYGSFRKYDGDFSNQVNKSYAYSTYGVASQSVADHNYFGRKWDNSWNFDGTMDELRISDVWRNESWLNATADTCNNTIGFLLIGQEINQTVPGISDYPPSVNIPISNGTQCPCCPVLSINISDNTSAFMNATWYTNYTGGNVSFAEINNATNGTYILTFYTVDILFYDSIFWFNVSVNDGNNTIWLHNYYIVFNNYTNCNTSSGSSGNVEISFQTAQLGVFITLILFIFFFYVGYSNQKRSAGAFMILASFMLFSLDFLLVSYVDNALVLVLISPFAIFVLMLGVNKLFYDKSTKTEND